MLADDPFRHNCQSLVGAVAARVSLSICTGQLGIFQTRGQGWRQEIDRRLAFPIDVYDADSASDGDRRAIPQGLLTDTTSS